MRKPKGDNPGTPARLPGNEAIVRKTDWIRKLYIPIASLGLVLGSVLILPTPGAAKIYKYQKNGVWVYTDTPSEEMPANRQEVTESGSDEASPPATGRVLLANYPAANGIERAAAGTVAIESALGSGSGFFISSSGYIITNKHVIRTTDKQRAQTTSHIQRMETQITRLSTRFSKENQRLQNFKNQVDQLKKATKAENNSARKNAYQANYEAKLTQYQQWKEDYNLRHSQFKAEKDRFESSRSDFDYARNVTDLSQSFTIILADNTRLYARVIAVSPNHDLALLKLDGYQTPTLSPATGQSITQGDPVYAIGNPATLKNSVTSGAYSGHEGGFVKTDAQIYPGNSGGPLVTEMGQVIGINTFKKLTHKFEGLGFAIPIQRALDEFSKYLP